MAIGNVIPQLEWRDFSALSTELLYEFLAFRQGIFVVEQGSPYADLDGLDRRAHHLMLRVNSALAGYLRVMPWPEEQRVAIGRVAVAAAARGHGLAARLMQAALDRCRTDYIGYRVTLSAQTYLVPFYQSLGFRILSAPYDDFGVPHIDMIKLAGG